MNKVIVYFSWSNNTKELVEEVNQSLNLPIYRIERKIPYSADYDTCAYIEAKEEVNKHLHPEIVDLGVNFNQYDEILLFFPIWWYTHPMPIETFIESIKGYKGKVVVFANSYTNDPQYMVNSLRDLRNIDSNINYIEGLFNKSVKEHIKFIKEN